MKRFTMMKHFRKINESGLTLVEVVASIVIITLIITSFLTMFIQSAKTNKASEKTINSTYDAQVEMENIYAISKDYSLNQRESGMNQLSYTTIDSILYSKTQNGKYFEARLTLENNELVRVIVRVYNNEEEKKLEAQMETLLIWEADEK